MPRLINENDYWLVGYINIFETMAEKSATSKDAADAKFAALVEWIGHMSKNNIQQRTEEWHAARKYEIGGSTIGTITGSNYFGSIREFVSERLGLTKFKQNYAMMWGVLLEPAICKHCEQLVRSTIIGSDLYVRGVDFGRDGVSYSPDGFAIMTNKQLDAIPFANRDDTILADQAHEDEDESRIVLFEFKCVQKINKKPKQNRIEQLLMGLDLLDICDIGVLAEAQYIKCSAKEEIPENCPYGSVGFYFPTSVSADVGSNCADQPFANVPELTQKYGLAMTNLAFGDEPVEWPSGDFVRSGIMWFYLQDIRFVKVAKRRNFISDHMEKIKEVIDIIKFCENSPNKQHAFNGIFRSVRLIE